MAVKIGSARGDERGKISGGQAGDQTGREVSTQNWYKHSKGWRVFRCKDPNKAQKIAECMEWACASSLVGYDQGNRSSLYSALKELAWQLVKLKKKVETDCSGLVRVCCAYAGVVMSDFNTSTEATRLLNSGEFVELTDTKYRNKSDYLQRGDILVTKTKGHTVVVLSNGPKAEGWGNIAPPVVYHLGSRILKNGMEGDDVRKLQTQLIQLGYSCGSYGIDGEFGDATELAVRKFQREHKCEVDGEVGPETIKALEASLGGDDPNGYHVQIIGGNCYVRPEPVKNDRYYGVAKEGEMYPYLCEKSPEGWLKIQFKSCTGWVSGNYAKIV